MKKRKLYLWEPEGVEIVELSRDKEPIEDIPAAADDLLAILWQRMPATIIAEIVRRMAAEPGAPERRVLARLFDSVCWELDLPPLGSTLTDAQREAAGMMP